VKVTRIVRVNSYGVGGCSFTVTFKGVGYRVPGLKDTVIPRITTRWASMSGDDKELYITSGYFASPEEAAKWIEDLTREVKEYCLLDEQVRQRFGALEGESAI
jgi:hypothetical protein